MVQGSLQGGYLNIVVFAGAVPGARGAAATLCGLVCVRMCDRTRAHVWWLKSRACICERFVVADDGCMRRGPVAGCAVTA